MENKDKCSGCGSDSCSSCDTKSCNAGGKCGSCFGCHGCFSHNRMWKRVLVIVVVIMAYWVGSCIGELKGEIKANYRGQKMYMKGDFDKYKNLEMNKQSGDTVTPEAPTAQ